MSEFVICIDNGTNAASLVVGKAYHALADAEARGLLRIVDEDKSEPDGHLYSADMFIPIELPEEAKQALTVAGIL